MANVGGKYLEDSVGGAVSDGCGQMPPYPTPIGAILSYSARGVVDYDAAAVLSSLLPSPLLILHAGQDVVVTEWFDDFH